MSALLDRRIYGAAGCESGDGVTNTCDGDDEEDGLAENPVWPGDSESALSMVVGDRIGLRSLTTKDTS